MITEIQTSLNNNDKKYRHYRLKINSYNEFDDDLKDKNITRKDMNRKSWDKSTLLKNAPNHDGDELNIEYVLGDD